MFKQEVKFRATADGLDYIIQVESDGTNSEAELQLYVADPAEFQKIFKKTVIVVLDESALWLKLRGEEKVYHALAEILSQQARRHHSKKLKPAQDSRGRQGGDQFLLGKRGRRGEHAFS